MIKAIDQYNYSHIARITGDDLLRDYSALDEGIKQHLEKNVDYTCMDGLPYGVATEIFSSRFIKEIAFLAEEPDTSEYLTWFADNSNVNSIHRLSYGFSEHYRLTVDTPEDYEVFKRLNEVFKSKLVSVSTKEIVDFLYKNPSIAKINSMIQLKIDKPQINTQLSFFKELYEANK